jgi:ComF family protein
LNRRESDTESSWRTKLSQSSLQIPKDILDFIFPRICIVSGEKIPEGNSNPFVIDSILHSLSKISLSDKAELLSKIEADDCTSLFRFSGECEMSQIIHTMKYKGFRSVGEVLGRILGEELKHQQVECDYIIPVPIHKARKRERGFNQSYHISKGVSDIIGGEVIDDMVVRVRNTQSQTTLNKAERSSNVKEAFEFNAKYKHSIENYRVLIVDDVITTGATIIEMVKVLRLSGVKKVVAGSVAMATGELRI